MNTTVRIYDLNEDVRALAVDLRHVLRALGPRTIACFWKVSHDTLSDEPLFATGTKADRLERLAESGDWVDGAAIRDLAENVSQVIWGEFRGHAEAAAGEPWVIIRAIDSSSYEVSSNDPAVHEAVRGAFRDVRPSARHSTPDSASLTD